MSDCPKQNKWFRGCKFEARYDLGVPDLSQFASIERGVTSTVLEQFRKKTYVRDVCVTCGKTIDRKPS